MISIVVHGIMGATYRQDVVVDEGVRTNGCIQVLFDIRRQLSTHYGDGTPLTGWALQPAPAGFWISRIERAFDANYAPAYVMFSFLVSYDKRLRPEALQYIEQNLESNHGRYMQQSVVQHDADWNFLLSLAKNLECFLEEFDNDSSPRSYSYEPVEGCAYWPDDMPSMLQNIEDARFRMFHIVFCGKQILAAHKDFVSIFDVPPIAIETSAHESTQTISQIPPPFVSYREERENAGVEENVIVDAGDSENTQKHKWRAQKRKQRSNHKAYTWKINTLAMNFIVIVGVCAVVFLVAFIKVLTTNVEINADDQPVSMLTVDSLDNVNEKVGENIKKQVVVSETSQMVNSDEEYLLGPGRIVISAPEKLFLCLTWDNVEDNGRIFYEKYEIKNRTLKHRAENIIRMAPELGKIRYQKAYQEAMHSDVSNINTLEKLLKINISY